MNPHLNPESRALVMFWALSCGAASLAAILFL